MINPSEIPMRKPTDIVLYPSVHEQAEIILIRMTIKEMALTGNELTLSESV